MLQCCSKESIVMMSKLGRKYFNINMWTQNYNSFYYTKAVLNVICINTYESY